MKKRTINFFGGLKQTIMHPVLSAKYAKARAGIAIEEAKYNFKNRKMKSTKTNKLGLGLRNLRYGIMHKFSRSKVDFSVLDNEPVVTKPEETATTSSSKTKETFRKMGYDIKGKFSKSFVDFDLLDDLVNLESNNNNDNNDIEKSPREKLIEEVEKRNGKPIPTMGEDNSLVRYVDAIYQYDKQLTLDEINMIIDDALDTNEIGEIILMREKIDNVFGPGKDILDVWQDEEKRAIEQYKEMKANNQAIDLEYIAFCGKNIISEDHILELISEYEASIAEETPDIDESYEDTTNVTGDEIDDGILSQEELDQIFANASKENSEESEEVEKVSGTIIGEEEQGPLTIDDLPRFSEDFEQSTKQNKTEQPSKSEGVQPSSIDLSNDETIKKLSSSVSRVEKKLDDVLESIPEEQEKLDKIVDSIPKKTSTGNRKNRNSELSNLYTNLSGSDSIKRLEFLQDKLSVILLSKQDKFAAINFEYNSLLNNYHFCKYNTAILKDFSEKAKERKQIMSEIYILLKKLETIQKLIDQKYVEKEKENQVTVEEQRQKENEERKVAMVEYAQTKQQELNDEIEEMKELEVKYTKKRMKAIQKYLKQKNKFEEEYYYEPSQHIWTLKEGIPSYNEEIVDLHSKGDTNFEKSANFNIAVLEVQIINEEASKKYSKIKKLEERIAELEEKIDQVSSEISKKLDECDYYSNFIPENPKVQTLK